ncbi:MAG: right-handed parallel beta-helix repeat-containing protein [Nocardioidaceae bacterium]|nr:right-handed parallel beta-helix repeat-containing protein [Nocardioidaceae bacterium]
MTTRTRKRPPARLTGTVLLAVTGLVAGAQAPAAASPDRTPQETHLHVAPWGDDGDPGTRGRPFRTVQRAQQDVRSLTARMRGDVVVDLHAGTYRLTQPLTLRENLGDSGENGHRVVWQPYRYGTSQEDDVVLSGGRDITGWTAAGDGSWTADAGDLETRQLYVDGVRARRASIGGTLPDLTRTPDGFTTSSTAPLGWQRPQDVELVFTGAFTWAEPRCGVASVSPVGGGAKITMKQPCFRRLVAIFGANGFPGTGVTPATIENDLSFLTQPGTFYLDRSVPGQHVLHYRPRPGEQVNRSTVVAASLERIVDAQGTDTAPLHDVTFRGLTFAEGTWLQPSTDEGFVHYLGGFFENGDGTQLAVSMSAKAQNMPGNVLFRRVEDVTVERNRFRRLGATGLELVGSDSVVRGNELTDISGGGVIVGDDRPETAGAVTEDDLVSDNWVHRIGVEYQGSTGIFGVRTTRLTIAHNQVNDLPSAGIVVGQAHNQNVRANGPVDPAKPHNSGARILGNLVFDYMNVLYDSGGIYTTFHQGTSWDDAAEISGNVIHDMQQPYWALYTDWGSSWIKLTDNVVYDFSFGSTGGCSFASLGAQITHLRFEGNFWADSGPVFWCGPVEDVTTANNTQLPADDTQFEAACQANPRCAAIVREAGLEPAYRDLLG